MADHPDEAEMRDAKVPWIKDRAELHAYIDELVDRPHDYGTCVYAMSMAAVAAYNYAAGKLGTTGFQAGCADLDIIRRLKGWDRFGFINFADALYPQYDLHAKLRENLADMKPWLAEEASKLLAERHENAHPNVVDHWKRLAEAA